jgi:hypothetical protein
MAGRKEADEILERSKCGHAVSLQVNEYVFPLADSVADMNGAASLGEWTNRLLYGDNLFLMEALLAGDVATGLPSMKGKIDLLGCSTFQSSLFQYGAAFFSLVSCAVPLPKA